MVKISRERQGEITRRLLGYFINKGENAPPPKGDDDELRRIADAIRVPFEEVQQVMGQFVKMVVDGYACGCHGEKPTIH